MADALDILPLAELKHAIRITGDDPAHDELLTSYIRGAFEWIADATGRDYTDADVVAADVPKPIKSAVALVVRAMYDLDARWPDDAAVHALIAPYRLMTVGGQPADDC